MKFAFRPVAAAIAILFCVSLLPVTAFAKDDWIEVRTKNFYLIGNAPEKDVRKVATKLEQFRETFRRLFTSLSFTSPVPTNVFVFKSDAAYRPFKPKRADGKPDDMIAGYFQPGEDVNYITLSTEGTDDQVYGTIFHEYVHFIMNTNFGKSSVPGWFNEGLAEYYQTFQIEKDQEAKLGLPQNNHILLLRHAKMMPLADMFNTSNRALGRTGHSRSIFYAQSWALVHYLIRTGKQERLENFLRSLAKDTEPEKAFRDAFQISYEEMEKELRKYVSQSSYEYSIFKFSEPLVFDTEMTSATLAEHDASAYLGDLLFHIHQPDDAEPFLAKAIAAQSDHVLANTTMGMVKMRQRKFADAKQFLQKAVTINDKNHLALYRFAYLLSRESSDDLGVQRKLSAEQAENIRSLLRKAIAANPSFTEPHDLFAYVSLLTGESLDEALQFVRSAMKYQPGNQRYSLRMAELLSRQMKFDEASAIAKKIAATADDEEVKGRAEGLAELARRNAESMAQYEENKKKYEEALKQRQAAGSRPQLTRRAENSLTEEQLLSMQKNAELISLNSSVSKAVEGQERVLGSIQKIECPRGRVLFTINSDGAIFTLSSADFAGLQLTSFVEGAVEEFGCGTKIGDHKAVLIFKPSAAKGPGPRGSLVSIDLVPSSFKFMTEEEMNAASVPPAVVVNTGVQGSGNASAPPPDYSGPRSAPPPPRVTGSFTSVSEEERAAERRKQILDNIRNNIGTPAAGEERAVGAIQGVECTTKGVYLYFKTADRTLKLEIDQKTPPRITTFSRDADGMQFGCGMKADDLNVVVTFLSSGKPKAKIAGTVSRIDVVPHDFKIED